MYTYNRYVGHATDAAKYDLMQERHEGTGRCLRQLLDSSLNTSYSA